MATLYKKGDYWIVKFSINGRHRERWFKSKKLAEKILGLFEGWKEIIKAKEFIRFAIDQGLLNQEQKVALELVFNGASGVARATRRGWRTSLHRTFPI